VTIAAVKEETVKRSVVHGLPRVAVVAAACAVLGAGLWLCDRGLDRVDESYVLAGVADPDASRAAGEVTLSSFVLHPLFAFVDGDIARYRLIGVLLVTVLSAVTMDRLTRCIDALTGIKAEGWARHLPWVGAAATSLTAFTFGLRSLSYNSLTLVGLLVSAVGFSFVLKRQEIAGGVTAALGWWTVFLGKPTSAAALAIVGTLALFLVRRVTPRATVAAVSALVVAVTVTLLAVRMTLPEVVTFLAGGMRQDQLLGGHVSVLQLVGLAPSPLTALLLLGLPLVIAGAVAVEIARRPGRSGLLSGLTLVGLACMGVIVAIVPSVTDRGLGLQILPFVLTLLVFGAWLLGREAYRRRRDDAPERRVPREPLVLTAFLALMPYVASVGTNSPFTEAMPHYAVFWLMATLVGLRALGGPEVVRVIVIGLALGVTSVMLVTALLDGGSISSLLAAHVRVPVAGGALVLPADEARVATYLNEMASREGLTSDTPVVDLTGISPGYSFQLGGRPLGRESFMGVFPGAPDAAAYALSRAPCADRARAWVLWASDNPWGVDGKVDLGRRIPHDYDVVGQFSPVQGPAGWRQLVVNVLRPRAGGSTSCPN
jgi:hypothetical protein